MTDRVRFDYAPSDSIPPLAWLADVRDGHVDVRCGRSVRCTADGFAEGTWVGAGELRRLPDSTTVFGSGIVDDGAGPVMVPPSHPLERLYVLRGDRSTRASNSLAWLLEATGATLRRDVLYPPILVAAADGVRHTVIDIPTSAGPVAAVANHNARLAPEQDVEIETRPRERPFRSFAEYRDRLTDALASAAGNAPGYEMLATISSGYDSTAVAAVAAAVGCRRAVTFATSKQVPGATNDDSGAASAERLAMSVEPVDRLAYMSRDDLPEAEFLATGMSGEDVVMVAMEHLLPRSLLLSGAEAFRLKGNPYRPGLYRGDLSSCSLTEFRLRLDFVHVPLLFFGGSEHDSLIRIIDSPEMRPHSVRGRYDKPIQRRLAEEAGIPRGTFATVKRRSSARLHTDGLAALAPESRAAVRAFAAEEGRSAGPRPSPSLRARERLALRVAHQLRLGRLVAPLAARRRALIHHEPHFGSLLFRWAVGIVSGRYAKGDDVRPGTRSARSGR